MVGYLSIFRLGFLRKEERKEIYPFRIILLRFYHQSFPKIFERILLENPKIFHEMYFIIGITRNIP